MEIETVLFSPLRLSDAAPAILAPSLPPVSPQTVRWWRDALTVFIRWLGRDVAVMDVSRHDVERWHAHLLGRMSPVTANNYLRAVRTIYARLLRLGYVDDNPAALPPAPQPPGRPQAIKPETYRALWDVAGVRERAVLGILWATGARIGELPTITLTGLQLWNEKGSLCLAAFVVGKHHRRLSPDKAGRYLYADGAEAAAVRDWTAARPPGRGDALFPSRDGDGAAPVPTLHSILRKLRHDAGLPPGVVANAHSFRHAFAYRKRREGYPLEWISEWLGHSDPAFTAKMYGDKSEPEIRRRFFEPPPAR